MKTSERRLLVDHSFDCTVETVIDAFLREGFAVREVEAGPCARSHATAPVPRSRMWGHKIICRCPAEHTRERTPFPVLVVRARASARATELVAAVC